MDEQFLKCLAGVLHNLCTIVSFIEILMIFLTFYVLSNVKLLSEKKYLIYMGLGIIFLR